MRKTFEYNVNSDTLQEYANTFEYYNVRNISTFLLLPKVLYNASTQMMEKRWLEWASVYQGRRLGMGWEDLYWVNG